MLVDIAALPPLVGTAPQLFDNNFTEVARAVVAVTTATFVEIEESPPIAVVATPPLAEIGLLLTDNEDGRLIAPDISLAS